MQKDARLSSIPVLAVTAYAGKGDEERIIAAGAQGYLSKPVSMMTFLESVQGIIGGSANVQVCTARIKKGARSALID
jgi:two-component system cell cycle response regulator DivK